MENTVSNTTEVVESLTIGKFLNRQGFVSFHPTIRTNANGYPFITFINADNEADNVYFSKSAAEGVKLDDEVTVDMLNKHQAALITYSDDREDRWMISNLGGNRVQVASLTGLL